MIYLMNIYYKKYSCDIIYNSGLSLDHTSNSV